MFFIQIFTEQSLNRTACKSLLSNLSLKNNFSLNFGSKIAPRRGKKKKKKKKKEQMNFG